MQGEIRRSKGSDSSSPEPHPAFSSGACRSGTSERVLRAANSLNIICCWDDEIASVIGEIFRPSSPGRYELTLPYELMPELLRLPKNIKLPNEIPVVPTFPFPILPPNRPPHTHLSASGAMPQTGPKPAAAQHNAIIRRGSECRRRIRRAGGAFCLTAVRAGHRLRAHLSERE